MKTKVYLAKSNRANIDAMMMLRAIIQENPNTELVEFGGGPYSNLPLINSDYLIVVPEKINAISVTIGKGLNQQIADFPLKENIYIVTEIFPDKQASIRQIKEIKHIEIDWASKWAECILHDVDHNLKQTISVPVERKLPPKEEDLNYNIPEF